MGKHASTRILKTAFLCVMLALGFVRLTSAARATSEKTLISVTDSSPWFTKGCSAGGSCPYWWDHTYDGHDYISTYTNGSQEDYWAKFKPYLSQPGTYEVYVRFYACENTSQSVPFTVRHSEGSTTVWVDEYSASPTWREVKLGTWDFDAGENAYVRVTDATGDPYDGQTGLTVGSVGFRAPDLVVDDIWIDPTEWSPGDTVEVYIQIANVGDADAVSEHGLQIVGYLDGVEVYQEGIEGLGACYETRLHWACDWPSDTESHTIRVEVDPDNYIEESDESNNERSCSFSAENAPPDKPSSPSPSDGAVGQATNQDLVWDGGDPDGDSVAYDVYLEANDSSPESLACDDVPSSTCDPGPLDQDTHYHWYVVARDEHGAETEGPVWDFHTLDAPTDTPTPTPSRTLTPTSTSTPESSATPQPTSTDTRVPSPTPPSTSTPIPSSTPEPTDTPGPTSTDTPLPSPAPPGTSTPTPTPTPEPTDTPSLTSTNTPTPSHTPTPTPTLTPTPGLLPAPTLSSPANGATGIPAQPTFSWSSVAGANYYWIMVATDQSDLPTDPDASACLNCVLDEETPFTSYQFSSFLQKDTTYYWQVQPFVWDGSRVTRQGRYSRRYSFTTSESVHDLVIDGISFVPDLPTALEPAEIVADIKNQGNEPSAAGKVSMSVTIWSENGKPFQAEEIDLGTLPSIPPGEFETVSFDYTFISHAHSDELELMLQVGERLDVDELPLNNSKSRGFELLPNEDVYMNCISEITFVCTMGLIEGEDLEFARELIFFIWDRAQDVYALYSTFQSDAPFRSKLAEVVNVFVDITWDTAKHVLEFTGRKLVSFVLDYIQDLYTLIRAAINEGRFRSCGEVAPVVWDMLSEKTKDIWDRARDAGQEVFFFIVDSPVDVVVEDANGDTTSVVQGTVTEGIEDSFAIEFNTHKAIAVVGGETYTATILGTNVGESDITLYKSKSSLSQELTRVLMESPDDEALCASSGCTADAGSLLLALEYENVETTEDSRGCLTVGRSDEDYTLELDYDGDGATEEERQPDSVGLLEDTTAPWPVTDLRVIDSRPTSVTLSWTAPGDNERVGTSEEYDVRYSSVPITADSWQEAVQCDSEPLPSLAGSRESFTVGGLSPSETYHFALKAADEVPNWSGLSNSAEARTGARVLLPVILKDL